MISYLNVLFAEIIGNHVLHISFVGYLDFIVRKSNWSQLEKYNGCKMYEIKLKADFVLFVVDRKISYLVLKC